MEVLGIIPIALSAARTFHNFITDLQDASPELNALNFQVGMFRDVLENIGRGLEENCDPKSSILAHHSRQLKEAITGGCAILKEVEGEFKSIGVNSYNTAGLDRRPVMNALVLSERLRFLWNNDRVKRWSAALSQSSSTLSLLLQSHCILREDTAVSQEMTTEDTISMSETLAGDDTNLLLNERVKDAGGSEQGPELRAHPVTKHGHHNTKRRKRDRLLAILGVKGEEFDQSTPAPSMPKRSQSNPLLEQQLQLLSREAKSLVPDCPELRVLLLGKTGVGKSTLCSKVLGIPQEESEKLFGNTTPPDHITKPLSSTVKHLVLHDAGGFEAGSEALFQAVRQFIESKRRVELKDQIHCIWYLISCADRRPIQHADREFLSGRLIDTGEIPIFVVFTGYDELVDNMQTKNSDSKTPGPRAEKLADEYFQKHIFPDVEELVAKNHPEKFSFCKVGLGPSAEFIPKHIRSKEPVGTTALVEQMSARLRGDELRILWVSAQQTSEEEKLVQSVSYITKMMLRMRRVTHASFLPYVCLVGLGSILNLVFRKAKEVWQIRGLDAVNVPYAILRAIFNLSDGEMFAAFCACLANFLGPLTTPIISEIVLKAVLGINLILHRFHKRQALQDNEPLSPQQMLDEIRGFRTSEERRAMNHAIGGRVQDINFEEHTWTEEVMGLSKEALVAASGRGAISSVIRETRQKAKRAAEVHVTSID